MAQENKQHLRVDAFSESQNFRSRRRGPEINVPARDRVDHGARLTHEYQEVINTSTANRADTLPITEEMGIYVELISFQACELPIDSLDTKDFELRSCRKVGDREIAIVFVPDSRRNAFHQKLNLYLDPTKDGRNGPRNHNLIDSIEFVQLANIRSFWTDAPNLYPENPNQQVWWELWLKKNNSDINHHPLEVAQQLSERLGLRLGNSYQIFFDTVVTLIYASVEQLQSATELISSLEELRTAQITPNFFVESSPKDQQVWNQNLAQRITLDPESDVSIAILDNGINYHHPLLSHVTQQLYSEKWNLDWPDYNNFIHMHSPGWDHGSRQAGIAAFGNLQDALINNDPIRIPFFIESGRILPDIGVNDPELYGAITTGVSSKLVVERPDTRRVFSLAVTADSQRATGQPTSWSSEIDKYTFGIQNGDQQLFVISTGNIREQLTSADYWTHTQLAEAEEPSQSWNSISVGAYTEMHTNDDPTYGGWSPLSVRGDISPVSRTSVNWRWRKQAPFKPDLVAEGGNRLISPNQDEITNADVVSLLTTSGNAAGQLFEVTGDTSAATATVSRQAAILMSENPDYWPETIRALLIHSAEWSDQMWSRFGQLQGMHSPKISKEIMLRTFGYGVSNLQRARYSANHALTLVAQNYIQPFIKRDPEDASANPTLNEMCLFELPWPIDVLQQLDPLLEIKLRVTLSYFIEPNPGRRGYRQRFSYQSHGLRFDVIRPGQSFENFKAGINALANNEDYDGLEGDGDGWKLGSQLRTRGSVHSDTWIGSAQALADMNKIAVYPVGGWWKYKRASDKWMNQVRFSLIVSIDVPDTEIDIYSSVETLIQTEILI